ncbi:MAG: hypothetical protein ACE5E5_06625 [Phycisphaerae bacterium]
MATVLLLGMATHCAPPKRNAAGFLIAGSGSLFGPKGQPWTILCLELRGPERQARMEQIAATLRRSRGIRAEAVVVTDDPDDVSRLYYGVYYRRIDPETGNRTSSRRLQDDMKLIKSLGTPAGVRYFRLARTVRVPTPDVGNPQWRLAGIEAAYSLQVAVFEPTDDFWDFKQAAVDYCAMLRKRGYEAYYHHGEGASMVTVGRFGPEAVIIPARGIPYQSAEVTALQRDETLRYNRLNGKIYRAPSEDGTLVRVKSRLVEVPTKREVAPW